MSRIAGIALFAVAVLGGAGAAHAQGFGAGNWYVKGFGGATWPSSEDVTLRGFGQNFRLDLDYDTGYALGAALGYRYSPNVAFEVEYAYRRADFSGTLNVAGTRFREDGKTKSNSVMLNALYVFDGVGASGAVQPYLGAGLGGAKVDVDGDSTDVVFAYQLIAGVGYDVTPNWTLMGEARWYPPVGPDRRWRRVGRHRV